MSSKLLTIAILSSVDKTKCPESVRYKGTHVNGYYFDKNDGKFYWNYTKIKEVIMG